ncbi:hypothetical protein JKP88DRAFT_286753 [Tribonema minus]|uniref:HEAT repeat-containing protein 1 n=1 Tax=Tribonema minus TaxID=303371 RepID=A0A835Z7Y2_9STRA|nr:hypothetical protein JKP88DRAFT_286753 [Tribonema minus]
MQGAAAAGASTAAADDRAAQLQQQQAAALHQLTLKLQRDVNCLSDPDRTTRRRALSKLDKVLVGADSSKDGSYASVLGAYFTQLLRDPVEKCRELSAGLLISLVARTEDTPDVTLPLVEVIVPTVCARIGSTPVEETAEEVRLLLLKLLTVLWSRESAVAWASPKSTATSVAWASLNSTATSGTADVLATALADPFPDAKRECCVLLRRVVQVTPEGVRLHLGRLLRPLVGNLVEGLSLLLACGADDLAKPLEELVLPQLNKLVFDSEPRAAYLAPHHATLLALLIMEQADDATEVAHEAERLADDAMEVAHEAQRLVDELGQLWATHQSQVADMDVDQPESPAHPPHPPSAAPTEDGQAAKAYCLSQMPKMMPATLEDMMPATLEDIGHWTVKSRHRAVQLLQRLIRYAGDDIALYLPSLVPQLRAASQDEEADSSQDHA